MTADRPNLPHDLILHGLWSELFLYFSKRLEEEEVEREGEKKEDDCKDCQKYQL